jgi:hypothetical protein
MPSINYDSSAFICGLEYMSFSILPKSRLAAAGDKILALQGGLFDRHSIRP